MHKLRTAVLSSIAALTVAGAALAASRNMHVMNVGLPGGAVARIEYESDVAPKVIVAPAQEAVPVNIFDTMDTAPFAILDRIATPMSRDMDAMIHNGAFEPMPPSADDKIDLAALAKLPAGTVHYQFVSTSDGSGTCSRSVEVTSHAPDNKPRIVSNSVGGCASTNRTPTPTRLGDPTAPAFLGLTRTGMTVTAEPYHKDNVI